MEKDVVIEAKPIDIGIIKNFVNPLSKPDLPSYWQFVFSARGPLPYLEPIKRDKLRNYDNFFTKELNPLKMFDNQANNNNVKKELFVSKDQKRRNELKEYLELKTKEFKKWRKFINKLNLKKKNLEDLKNHKDEKIKYSSNPYKTLIVYNLSYDLKEEELKEFFEKFGEVIFIRIIMNDNKSKGYGFVEFKYEKDFLKAYNKANHEILKSRKICVDAERARIEDNFRPMRLGGGKNKSRRIKKKIKIKKTNEEENNFKPKKYLNNKDNNNRFKNYRNNNNRHNNFRYKDNRYNNEKDNRYNNEKDNRYNSRFNYKNNRSNFKNNYRNRQRSYSNDYYKRRQPSYEKWKKR